MNPRTPKPDGEQELQKTLMQLEGGRRRLEALGKQGQMVENALIEVNTAIHSLETLKDVKEGTEILVPIGANTFIKATLKDKETILVGIGAGMSVEKSRPDTVKSLESRREELTKTMGNIQKISAELAASLDKLNDTAEGMIGASRQQ